MQSDQGNQETRSTHVVTFQIVMKDLDHDIPSAQKKLSQLRDYKVIVIQRVLKGLSVAIHGAQQPDLLVAQIHVESNDVTRLDQEGITMQLGQSRLQVVSFKEINQSPIIYG